MRRNSFRAWMAVALAMMLTVSFAFADSVESEGADLFAEIAGPAETRADEAADDAEDVPQAADDAVPEPVGGEDAEPRPVEGDTEPAADTDAADGTPDPQAGEAAEQADAAAPEVRPADREPAAGTEEAAARQEEAPAQTDEPRDGRTDPASAEASAESAGEAGSAEGGDGKIVGDLNAVPDNKVVVVGNVTCKVGDTGLTVSIKGLTAKEQAAVIAYIENNMDVVLVDGSTLEVVMPGMIDAEKIICSGRDSMLCWAATAANMLWTSGYAQQAENPATGAKFANVDEVFEYFRNVFTDVAGIPDGGVSVFISGVYDYDQTSLSQLKESVEALLPDTDWSALCKLVDVGSDVNQFSSLDHFDASSFGVLLHTIDMTSYEYTGLAHWVTAAGVVTDESAKEVWDRYKAILIADSDNRVPLSASCGPDTDEAACVNWARYAAKAPNSFTMYKLSLVDCGKQGQKWAVNFGNYGENTTVVIDYLCTLKDSPVKPEEPPEEPEKPSTPRVEQYKDYNYADTKSRMVRGDWIVYSPANWTYTAARNDTFDVFVRTSVTMMSNVHLDGELLTVHQKDYRLIDCRNGLCLLVLSEDLMRRLPAGEHTLTMEIRGVGTVERIITVQ